MVLSHSFNALLVTWAASEFWIGLRRRSTDHSRQRDGGTLRLLVMTVYVSIALGVWLSRLHAWLIPEPPRHALVLLGMAMMIAGIVLRWWSVRVLAEYFTVDVSIRPDHRLIRDGPYRLLRHPSYTGALATFYGFALCLGDIAALLVVILPVTLAFLWRIRVEEDVLAQAFPADYPAYARDTKRLLPGIW